MSARIERDVNHRADARRKTFCSTAGSGRKRPGFFTMTVVATRLASPARRSSFPTSSSARNSPPPAVRAGRPVSASGAKTGPSLRLSWKFGEILNLHCQSVGKGATRTDRLLSSLDRLLYSLDQTPPTCPWASASSAPRHGGHVCGRPEREEAEGRTQRENGRGGGAGTTGTAGHVHRRRRGLCPSADASVTAATPPSPQHAAHTGNVEFLPASLTASRRREAPTPTAT